MHKTSIGGQAVIEGIMMRGPSDIAIAVRKSDGEIVIDKKPVKSVKYKILKLPIIRGVFNFFSSLVTGVKSLMFSAEFVDIEGDEQEEPSKIDKWLTEKLGDKLKDIAIYFSVAVSLVFSVLLFIMLPAFLTGFIKKLGAGHSIIILAEGVVRIAIFMGYLFLVSKMKDIQRVFEYHGAEHKSIYCYEHGEELTVENVKKYTRLHPRCGTSFLFIVMIISIIVFFFIKSDVWYLRLVYRLLLLPVVAGISYEIIKLAGRYDTPLTRAVSKPGMWLQYFTTREPDDSQIEVAIVSLKAVIPENKEDDKW
ncbi:MAG: DUF1385 domain-containing protein [Clostridia bacterium]|nr:DUF1385 domain-containing protein [Clostridia bacterium]